MNISYRLDCKRCHPEPGDVNDINPVNRSIYLGCSGRSLHSRLQEHESDIVDADSTNAMVKHLKAAHPEDEEWRNEQPIRARVIKNHMSTLKRLIDESLRLEANPGLANSKSEWGRGGGLVRNHAKRTNDPGGG